MNFKHTNILPIFIFFTTIKRLKNIQMTSYISFQITIIKKHVSLINIHMHKNSTQKSEFKPQLAYPFFNKHKNRMQENKFCSKKIIIKNKERRTFS